MRFSVVTMPLHVNVMCRHQIPSRMLNRLVISLSRNGEDMDAFWKRQDDLLARINRAKPNSRYRRRLEELQFNNTTKELMREVGKRRRKSRQPAA